MTEEVKNSLSQLLKQFSPNQPFTIEELTRQLLSSKELVWQHYHEIEAQNHIEQYLKDEGLVQEYGTTTLYNLTKKALESK